MASPYVLLQTRGHLVSLLADNTGPTEDALDDACKKYISLLLGLVDQAPRDAGD